MIHQQKQKCRCTSHYSQKYRYKRHVRPRLPKVWTKANLFKSCTNGKYKRETLQKVSTTNAHITTQVADNKHKSTESLKQ